MKMYYVRIGYRDFAFRNREEAMKYLEMSFDSSQDNNLDMGLTIKEEDTEPEECIPTSNSMSSNEPF